MSDHNGRYTLPPIVRDLLMVVLSAVMLWVGTELNGLGKIAVKLETIMTEHSRRLSLTEDRIGTLEWRVRMNNQKDDDHR